MTLRQSQISNDAQMFLSSLGTSATYGADSGTSSRVPGADIVMRLTATTVNGHALKSRPVLLRQHPLSVNLRSLHVHIGIV